MTIHYHGTPISPRPVLLALHGRSFCVSFAAKHDVAVCHDIGEGVMLDNGAFSVWRIGKAADWRGYYEWADQWLNYRTTWAVIPDVIGGSGEENDALISQWPHKGRGAPVWHLHEPIDRLLMLCDTFERVCFGSSGEFSVVGKPIWHVRMEEAFDAVSARHRHLPWLHMLRGMSLAGRRYPFASVDSTDIARNHHLPHKDAVVMANRWDARQCPGMWTGREKEKWDFGVPKQVRGRAPTTTTEGEHIQ